MKPVQESHLPELTYGSYLQISDLVKLQRTQSNDHDELLFIIIHQTCELWFKQILHEIECVILHLRRANTRTTSHYELHEAARLLQRCSEIMGLLVGQFAILETILPQHFLSFRSKLFSASGFQSQQFREIEFLCGLKDEKLLSLYTSMLDDHAGLARRFQEPSLHDVLFETLASLSMMPSSAEYSTDRQRVEARIYAIQMLYQNKENYEWIGFCERLAEFDQLFVSWRIRHIQVVERAIGLHPGTGGTTGIPYLKLTLQKRFFPEVWQARTKLSE